jgi:hypothetical protein
MMILSVTIENENEIRVSLDSNQLKLTPKDQQILLYTILKRREGQVVTTVPQLKSLETFRNLEDTKLGRLLYDRSLAWKMTGLDAVLEVISEQKQKVVQLKPEIKLEFDTRAVQEYLGLSLEILEQISSETITEHHLLEVAAQAERGKLKIAKRQIRQFIEKLEAEKPRNLKLLFLATYEEAWLLESIQIEEARTAISDLKRYLVDFEKILDKTDDNYLSETDYSIFNAMYHIRQGRYFSLTEKKFLAMREFINAIDFLLMPNEKTKKGELNNKFVTGQEKLDKDGNLNKIALGPVQECQKIIVERFRTSGSINYQLLSQTLFYFANIIAKQCLTENKTENEVVVIREDFEVKLVEIAIEILNFAIKISQVNKAIRTQIRIFFLLGWFHSQLAFHFKLENNNLAAQHQKDSQKYYNFATQISQYLELNHRSSGEELGLGLRAAFLDQYDKAIEHFKSAEGICDRTDNFRQKSKVELRLARMYQKKLHTSENDKEKNKILMELYLESAANSANECGLRRRYRFLIAKHRELRRDSTTDF